MTGPDLRSPARIRVARWQGHAVTAVLFGGVAMGMALAVLTVLGVS